MLMYSRSNSCAHFGTSAASSLGRAEYVPYRNGDFAALGGARSDSANSESQMKTGQIDSSCLVV
jgi:hypothetical protein